MSKPEGSPQTAPTAPSEAGVAVRGRMVFDPAWCRTCRVCEIACAIGHEGVARPAVARINIYFNEFAATDPISGVLCLQCEDAPCIEACPVEACRREPTRGAVIVDAELCSGCMRCAKACPWGVPKRHPDRKLAVKCDLCYDQPAGPYCVAYCPLAGKALRYEPEYYVKGNGHEQL